MNASLDTTSSRAGLPLLPALVALAGLIHLATGLALLLAPAWFYQNIGTFPPFNRHYAGDLGAFQVGLGVGLALGNVRIDAHAGGMVRAGYNIPNEFGVGRTGRGADLGFYIFAGAFGSAVALDIFLDGNTFRDSAHVDKKPFVVDAQAGLALQTGDWRLAYTYVTRTEEFEGQGEQQDFGALALSWRF